MRHYQHHHQHNYQHQQIMMPTVMASEKAGWAEIPANCGAARLLKHLLLMMMVMLMRMMKAMVVVVRMLRTMVMVPRMIFTFSNNFCNNSSDK